MAVSKWRCHPREAEARMETNYNRRRIQEEKVKQNTEVFRAAAALVHTSVDDARMSLSTSAHNGYYTSEILDAALDMIDGKPGHTSRRKLFESHLKKMKEKA
jgi:hypothetical protein